MTGIFIDRNGNGAAIPIWFADAGSYPAVREHLSPAASAFADACAFAPKAGKHVLLPSAAGALGGVLVGLEPGLRTPSDPFEVGRLAPLLPAGTYRFGNAPPDPRLAALAFGLGLYRFTRYRGAVESTVGLITPEGVDADALTRTLDAVTLARDLINTPANDLGPVDLETAARVLAERYGAAFRSVVGDDLLAENFPLIHAVGRAAMQAPRLIDFTWGRPDAPKVTLVGKGVCFDTGGLDLKPSSAMLLMKKDMGGAAAVLALAQMIMDGGPDVRLRVLVPAVENSVAGAAFRPLDVYRARTGAAVEIGNTDAEGRLVLADALALADEERPDLLVDMGTLTGAARVALGPDLPPFYTDDETLAADVARCAAEENDPLWRLPLWRRYESMLDSKVADFNNVSSGPFAGSITCALFLNRFVRHAKSWLHLDVYAWTPATRPGRPEGGECQAARALYRLLCRRYG